jgi:hypothetical protein
MTAIIEVPFSKLVQQPKETVARLEQSQSRRLRLERRDGNDLILESADRAEAKEDALRLTGTLFFHLMQNDEGARQVLLALPSVFPWVRFLPRDDVRGFLVELVDTLHACAELGNIAALIPVVEAWRATAEINSDPDLRRAATQSLDGTDYGEGATRPKRDASRRSARP